MLRNPKALLAGLMGLFGGLPQKEVEHARPSMDEVWKQAAKKETPRKREQNVDNLANPRRRLKKHRWRIARDSRKINYARNGTRG